MCNYSAKHLFSSVLHPQQILQASSSANTLMPGLQFAGIWFPGIIQQDTRQISQYG